MTSKRRNSSIERVISDCLARLDAEPLRAAMAAGGPTPADVGRIGDILLRSNLVITVPDADRARRRDRMLEDIHRLVAGIGGAEAAEALSVRLVPVAVIEDVYARLNARLDELLAGRDPAICAWASVSLGAHQARWALDTIDEQLRESAVVDGASFSLPDGVGGRYRADELMAMVDATTSTTLRMYARRWGWSDRDGAITLPKRVEVTDADREAALAIQTLAQAWELWRRIDDRVRFFGGTLERTDLGEGRSAIRHVPDPDDRAWNTFNLAAHEQLTAEIRSIFSQLVYREDRHLGAVGVDSKAPLFPSAYVSVSELQAVRALEIALSDDLTTDTSLHGGLRLVEWVRGYAVLAELAARSARGDGEADALLVEDAAVGWEAALTRLGLPLGRAATFLKHVRFSHRSRDVADEPLLTVSGGSTLLYGPAIVNGEVARILLSKLTREKVSQDRRGARFEAEMRRRFRDWGLPTHHGTVRFEREEYDYDLLVPWGDYLFLFECKSRNHVGLDPARSWQARQAWRAHVTQTRRLADFAERHPEVLERQLDLGVRGLTIVPCVLNASPFQMPGPVDGIRFNDLAGLATFFELGEVGAYATHRHPGMQPLRQALATRRLWSGSAPTAIDLIAFLDDPPGLRIMLAHLTESVSAIDIDHQTRIEAFEFDRLPDSVDLAIRSLGGNPAEAAERMLAITELVASLSNR